MCRKAYLLFANVIAVLLLVQYGAWGTVPQSEDLLALARALLQDEVDRLTGQPVARPTEFSVFLQRLAGEARSRGLITGEVEYASIWLEGLLADIVCDELAAHRTTAAGALAECWCASRSSVSGSLFPRCIERKGGGTGQAVGTAELAITLAPFWCSFLSYADPGTVGTEVSGASTTRPASADDRSRLAEATLAGGQLVELLGWSEVLKQYEAGQPVNIHAPFLYGAILRSCEARAGGGLLAAACTEEALRKLAQEAGTARSSDVFDSEGLLRDVLKSGRTMNVCVAERLVALLRTGRHVRLQLEPAAESFVLRVKAEFPESSVRDFITAAGLCIARSRAAETR